MGQDEAGINIVFSHQLN